MAEALELMSQALSARSGGEKVLTSMSSPIPREFLSKYFKEHMFYQEPVTSDIRFQWVNVQNQGQIVSAYFARLGVPVPDGFNNILLSFPPDSIHYNTYNPPFAYLMVFGN